MTEEIKEILDLLNFNKDTISNGTCRVEDFMSREQIIKLLDYITNLQQENKEYSMIFDTFSKRPYAHKYLEEKKKELNNNKIICLDSEMVYKDYYDYKSRCEKAIKYINNNKLYDFDYDKEELFEIVSDKIAKEYLLNILNGSDEK